MPRVTKAELVTRVQTLEEDLRVERIASGCMNSALDKMHVRMERLEMENEDLKAQNARRRSRSPKRFPATNAQVNMDVACKAICQVRLWQRDSVLQEHAEKIADLKAECDKKDAEIADLRRGSGPIGEVLLHNLNLRWAGNVSGNISDVVLRQTMPVNAVLQIVGHALEALNDTLLLGGPAVERHIPARRSLLD